MAFDRALGERFAPGLALLGLLLLWEAACWVFRLPAFVLPSPSAILSATWKLDTTIWAEHIFATLRVTLLGYGLSILIGVVPGQRLDPQEWRAAAGFRVFGL